MRKLKQLMGFVFLLFLVFIPSALADEAQLMKMIEKLQTQMMQMQYMISQQNDKIRQIERLGGAPAGTIEGPSPMSDKEFSDRLNAATGGADKWLKDLKFSGDLRLRYEGQTFHSGSPSETDPRNRFRLRLRYGFEKKFNEDMKIGFYMATGEQNDGLQKEPASANQTLTNNFNYKNIWIERAYATYTPHQLAKKGILEKSEVTAGKFANPFEKGSSDMVWDRDVRPEGIYEKVDLKFIDKDDFKLNSYFTGGQFLLHEDAALERDAQLFAVQAGLNPVFNLPKLPRPVNWLHAVSFYDFNNYARQNNFTLGGASLANGNFNVDQIPTELDANKFKIYEYYSELVLYPWPWNIPLNLNVDLAGNPADGATGRYGPTALDENFAYGFGLKLGQIKQKHDWELLYQYKYIGANSVVGAFTDSDFGSGFAGKRGNVFKLGYAITDFMTLNGAMFFVENLNPSEYGVIDQQQKRFAVDLSWKF